MNWDWDKLQEKRKHQPSVPTGKGKREEQNSHDNDYEPFNHDQNGDFSSQQKQRGGNFSGGNKNDPKQILDKINIHGTKWILLLLLILWLSSGIFIVKPDEAGVVLRFGAYARTVDVGLHYHMPFPIESVTLPKVTQVRQIIVGSTSSNNNAMFSRTSTSSNMTNDEAAMLTGDENIVNIQFSIQYYIKPDGVVDYLYKVAEPDAVVKKAAEAAMREIIGKTTLDSALTVGRSEIQDQVTALLQNILDSYQVGIQVVAVQMQDVQPPPQVRDAFKDVASAREDKERLTNEAEAYRSDILPKAQGTASAKVNQAEAYKQTRIRNAEGEASRFLAVLKEYNKAKDVTEKRLLLETLENMLSQPGIDKVIIPENASGQILPFLPLGPQNQTIEPKLTPKEHFDPYQNAPLQQPSRSGGRGLN